MTTEEKVQIFSGELEWIRDEKIRGFLREALSSLPYYFFTVAASSTGKYHPSYALGDGGLVRHTKAAVAIAKDLLGLEMYGRYSVEEKDLILAALVLHDGIKHGPNGGTYTSFRHPLDCVDFLHTLPWQEYLTENQMNMLCSAISSHMGSWNTSRSSREVLPKPQTAMQKFVHQCDYLASRKYLEVNFAEIHYEGVQV